MLTIVVPGEELFDEETSTFINNEETTLRLEHSLVSMSKWESFFEKPFLSTTDKTTEEVFAYIKFMILDDGFDQNIISRLSDENMKAINAYIDSSQSATTFGEMPQKKSKGEVITTELIYYFMVAFTIPLDCENWHINRLFSLIRICNIKNSKPEKLSKTEIAQRNHELNAQRRAKLNTKG